jgi:stage III sporulation protein AB
MASWLTALGAAGVVCGCGGWGFHKAAVYRQRPLELRHTATMLRVIAADISFARLPLSDALARAASVVPGQGMAAVFAAAARDLEQPGCTATAALSRQLAHNASHLALTHEDLLILEQLFRTIGQTGRDEQIAHLQAAVVQLEAREQEAVLQRTRYERLYQTMGVLAGVLIVILLI